MGDKSNRGKHVNPESAEKNGSKPGTRDAFCTECSQWYDSSNDSQVNRHAH